MASPKIGGTFYLLPEHPLETPRRVKLTGSEDEIFHALKRLIGTDMLEPFKLGAPMMAYGDEDGRMKMRQLNPWLRKNGERFNVVGTIVIGGHRHYLGAPADLLSFIEEKVINWPTGGRPGIAGR